MRAIAAHAWFAAWMSAMALGCAPNLYTLPDTLPPGRWAMSIAGPEASRSSGDDGPSADGLFPTRRSTSSGYGLRSVAGSGLAARRGVVDGVDVGLAIDRLDVKVRLHAGDAFAFALDPDLRLAGTGRGLSVAAEAPILARASLTQWLGVVANVGPVFVDPWPEQPDQRRSTSLAWRAGFGLVLGSRTGVAIVPEASILRSIEGGAVDIRGVGLGILVSI